MFKNYLIIAIRNLWRNKTFSLINIAGLALGIAFALLIGVFVWGEFQVNSKLKDQDRVYVVLSEWNPEEMGYYLALPPIVFKLLYDNYPHLVESYCREGEAFVNASKGDNRFYEDILMANSSLLNIFGFKLLHGNPKTALSEPYSALLTKKGCNEIFWKDQCAQ
jgi:putative ABC transport system permease protein